MPFFKVDYQLVRFTSDGGLAIRLTNKTGGASVRGRLVGAHTTVDLATELSGINDFDVIGVEYESGVGDGEEYWVVVSGMAVVLLADGTSAAAGN